MKSKKSSAVVPIAALAILSMGIILLAHARGGSGSNPVPVAVDTVVGTAARRHTPVDAPHAGFMSIFVYDARGGVSSFMVGGRTGEFTALSTGISKARMVAGESDQSVSELLVFSFGGDNTLELPYSQTRNLFFLSGQAYRPSTDLSPIIDSIEKKLT
ncbi:MAG: hypothetical protein M1309_03490 [Actinobacteria bacterium]|nr:hypothetical protein [Actinomycetota bacterium]